MLHLKNADLFRQQCFVGGNWIDASDGGTTNVINPASGEVIGTVPVLWEKDVQLAIDTAHIAQQEWKKKPAKERSAIILKWHDLMLENNEDLAQIMTAEQGKSLFESRGEIAYAASFLQWFAEEGKRAYGDTLPTPAPDRRLLTLKEPVGVCAAITPWNFPAAMIARKVGPALAVGCAIVVKPALQTPFSALAMGVLAQQAGLPAGLLSVVTGNAPMIGDVFTTSKEVRKLTFTGSTEVGKLLMAKCADHIKKISFELGGNAPFIVCEDADIDAAVEGAMLSKFRNTGQTCVCANRIFVHEKVYDEFAQKFTKQVQNMKVGVGTEDGVQQGPLIDKKAVHKVHQHVTDALKKGGHILTGGNPIDRAGNFYQPTVVANATSDMLCYTEETFGPFAPLFKFSDYDTVLKLANDTEFGLAGYFYSRDIGRIWKLAEGLECGMVGVNSGLIVSEVAPFGGYKQSGLGREGSKYGLDDYLETKYVCMAGL